MNPPIVTQIAHADPNAAPLNINELIDIFNPLLSSDLLGSYIPYILQHATPGVDDQDKAWIELDSTGKPLAIRIFYPPISGSWRRIYNGMAGEIRMFSGNPRTTTDWDTDGRGAVGGTYDGWQICNGNNGSPDLTDKFIVAAHMNETSGYDSGSHQWRTKIDGTHFVQTGGAKDHLIVAADLPPLDSQNGLAQLFLHGNEAKAGVDHTPQAKPIIDVTYANLQTHDQLLTTYGSDPNGSPPVPQTPIPTLPPFYALAFITFIGY
jgi:hypothetical protein